MWAEILLVIFFFFTGFSLGAGNSPQGKGSDGAREEHGASGGRGASQQLPPLPQVLSLPFQALLLHQRQGGGAPT